jgi:hypothetical protein
MRSTQSSRPSVSRADRRQLLSALDAVLEALEQLRLMDRTRVTDPVVVRGNELGQQVYGGAEYRFPRSLVGAHRSALRMVGRVLQGRVGPPAGSVDRREINAKPRSRPISGGQAIRLLTMPRSGDFGAPEWHRRAACVVERALDRWCLAQDLAVAAARRGDGSTNVRSLLEVARLAWDNYYDLKTQLEAASRMPHREVRKGRDVPLPQLGAGAELTLHVGNVSGGRATSRA